MQDQEIKCQGVNKDTPCPYGATFTYTVKDQEFYKEQGFDAPKRCRDCREAKKAQKDHGGSPKRYHEDRGGRRDHRGDRRDRGYRGHGDY